MRCWGEVPLRQVREGGACLPPLARYLQHIPDRSLGIGESDKTLEGHTRLELEDETVTDRVARP